MRYLDRVKWLDLYGVDLHPVLVSCCHHLRHLYYPSILGLSDLLFDALNVELYWAFQAVIKYFCA